MRRLAMRRANIKWVFVKFPAWTSIVLHHHHLDLLLLLFFFENCEDSEER